MTAVSVIIPTRNRREFVSEAIATVQDQTFPDWELIVVDDGSTDGTADYLKSLRDPRITSICRGHSVGQSASSNEALAVARGEFVMFLDDDDLLRPRALEQLVADLRGSQEAVSAAGACRLFREDGDSVRPYRPARAHTRIMWREFLFGWWSNSGQNLHRTALVRNAGGLDPRVGAVQDRKLWLQLAIQGPIAVRPDAVMERRQHATQMTKGTGIAPLRQAVWTEFIAGLPPSKQSHARRVRRAAELCDRSSAARAEGRFLVALWLQLRACATAPSLLTSPFLGRPFWWGIKKCIVRSTAP